MRARVQKTTKKLFKEMLAALEVKPAGEKIYISKDGETIIVLYKEEGDVIKFYEPKVSVNNIGYLQCATGMGSGRVETVHRLVAKAWLENPHCFSDVDHIDCDKTNNNVENLQWVSHSVNMQRAYANGLVSKSKSHKYFGRYIPATQFFYPPEGEPYFMPLEDYIRYRKEHNLSIPKNLKNKINKEEK